MEEKKYLLQAVKKIGRKNILNKLNISTERLNGWINKCIQVPYEYALMLEFLMDSEIKAEALSPRKAEKLKKMGIKIKFRKHRNAGCFQIQT